MRTPEIPLKWLVLSCFLFSIFGTNMGHGAPPDPPPPDDFLFLFDDLAVGERFSSVNQPYADRDGYGRGITIETDFSGRPTVTQESKTNLVLKNVGTNEFGTSEFSNLHIRLQGFIADVVEVGVGLAGTDAYPVTAHLRAYYQDSLVGSDSVDLGYGPAVAQHALRVEISDPETQAIDRVMISYGYTGGGAENAQQSEVLDDLYFRTLHATPEPPVDETDPVIHILEPVSGATVDSGWIMGYVVEEQGLKNIVLRSTPALGVVTVTPLYSVVGGEQRYVFYGWLPVREGANEFRVIAEDRAGNTIGESVTVSYTAPDYYPPPPEWPPYLNFEATGMEVTQAIQSWYNLNQNVNAPPWTEYELPAGKRTLVRVYAEVKGTETPIPDVQCRLHAFDADRVEMPGSPIFAIDPVTLHPGETWVVQREDLTKTFNFILPPEWTYGSVLLHAVVNEWNAIPEAVYDNFNNAQADVFFKETDDLCIFVYRIHSTNEGDVSPSWSEVTANLAYLRQIYPVTPENLIIHNSGRVNTERELDTGDNEEDGDNLGDLLDAFRRGLGLNYGLAQVAYCNHDSFLGLTHHTVEHRGVTDGYRPVSLSVAKDTNFYKIKTAHEVGHAQGLGHVDSYEPDCSGTDADGNHEPKEPYDYISPIHRPPDFLSGYYPDGAIGDWGVRFRGGNVFDLWDPETTGDLMSYCGTRWICKQTWNRLYNRFTSVSVSGASEAGAQGSDGFNTAAPPAPYFIISGTVKKGDLYDTARLDPAWQRMLAQGSSDHEGIGSYAIKLKSATGAILFTRRFDPVPKRNLEDQAGFYELLPAVSGTKTIVLNGPNLMKTPMISAGLSSPVVTVTYPDGGETWADTGIQVVTWNGNDADGDDLTYTVFYSHNYGSTWRVIGSDIKETFLFVSLEDLPGGTTSCRIRVAATDGINVGNDTSNAYFTKEGVPPTAAITDPPSGTGFAHEETIIFEGLATDVEDGRIPKDNITWWSNRDGMLGHGALVGASNLTPGVHTITLTVTDNDAMTESDTIYIHVAKAAPLRFDEWNDCDVDGRDLARFAAEFGNCQSQCFGDVEPDDDVDLQDLRVFARSFGYVCP